MVVSESTRRSLDDHLGHAEFALRVASHFDCLKGTPAHESVRAALTRVAEARAYVRQHLGEGAPIAPVADGAALTPAERHRIVLQRMARLRP